MRDQLVQTLRSLAAGARARSATYAAGILASVVWLILRSPSKLNTALLVLQELLTFGVTFVLVHAVILIVGIALVAARFFARRRARVFISYQHDRESAAALLSQSIEGAGLVPYKLDFLPEADHNALLDSVREGIVNCDVCVCMPGREPSFVEHEVAIAFGLRKPMLFLLTADESARVPNTAKLGYPVLDDAKCHAEGYRTLNLLCSYIAFDARAAWRVFIAAWVRSFEFLGLLIPVFFIDVTVSMVVPLFTPSEEVAYVLGGLLLLAILLLNALFFLVPFMIFVADRASTQRMVRDAIGGQKFSGQDLGADLDSMLSAVRLKELSLEQAVRPHHL